MNNNSEDEIKLAVLLSELSNNEIEKEIYLKLSEGKSPKEIVDDLLQKHCGVE